MTTTNYAWKKRSFRKKFQAIRLGPFSHGGSLFECLECGSHFGLYVHELARGLTGNFCCKPCKTAHIKKLNEKLCVVCGAPFYNPRTQFYCSRVCKNNDPVDREKIRAGYTAMRVRVGDEWSKNQSQRMYKQWAGFTPDKRANIGKKISTSPRRLQSWKMTLPDA